MNNSGFSFPVTNFGIDHYTLIVPNAKEVSDFHQHVLGYKLINTILVNAGSVPEGEFDMLNYVLGWPNNSKGVLVVTEGLTKDSIFHQFMLKFGQGIHHIAFEVEAIAIVFQQLKDRGIKVTSETLLRDPLSGLKQFFISSEYCGIFIELIERKSDNETKESEGQGFFTKDNMSGLASTMKSYIGDSNLSDKRFSNSTVRALDKKNYYHSKNRIDISTLAGITLHTQQEAKAKQFLSEILGFEEIGNVMRNSNEPDKFIRFSAMSDLANDIIQAKLTLNSSNVECNKKILQKLNLPFTENEWQLTLHAQYAGYPITLNHENNNA